MQASLTATTPHATRSVHRMAWAVNTPLVKALRHPWVESIVRLSAVEDALAAVHPMLSLTDVRARVVRIVDETATTKTFVLQPNALWAGALAGQFVRVQLEINGRRVERAYSLSSQPGAGRIAFTVKRQDAGLVSQHLHRTVRMGDVLTISQAMGEFVLPQALPAKIMSMLRDLKARAYRGDVVFLHVCRAPDDLIFAAQLQAIAADFPSLRLVLHYDATAGHFSPQALVQQVADLSERSTWMCGPAGFMDAISASWEAAGLDSPLFSERFVGAPLLTSTAPGTPVQVVFAHSGSSFTTQGTAPLLVQAERAGLTPKHGCRIGICRSCQCVKTHGTVENLQTGELSSAPNELIRLCISTARTDVALAL
jgi:ferredoxin-NADP reductase